MRKWNLRVRPSDCDTHVEPISDTKHDRNAKPFSNLDCDAKPHPKSIRNALRRERDRVR